MTAPTDHSTDRAHGGEITTQAFRADLACVQCAETVERALARVI